MRRVHPADATSAVPEGVTWCVRPAARGFPEAGCRRRFPLDTPVAPGMTGMTKKDVTADDDAGWRHRRAGARPDDRSPTIAMSGQMESMPCHMESMPCQMERKRDGPSGIVSAGS